jgi:cation diffusion facilitator CzcD-associated flavoprotein CzcO
VLTVGAGNSGCDLAVDIANARLESTISMRRGQMFQPKAVFGRPRAELRWLGRLPVRLNERIARTLSDIVIGPAQAYRDLPVPATRNLNEQPPVVNNLLPYWIHHGRIRVAPGIERLDGRRVWFVDGSSGEFDTILWATGFRVALPFLDADLIRWHESVPLRTAGLTLPVGVENLYLVGLAGPRGPQLPVYTEQAELVARMRMLARERRAALAARFAEIETPDARIDIVRAIWQRQMRDAHRVLDRAAAPMPSLR